jgi:Phage integrase SAM-like domain
LKRTLFGCDTLPLRNLRASQFAAWLSKHHSDKSASHYNSALQVIRAALDMAVRDRIITENPIAHLKYKKRATPIRLTPSFGEFQAIVENIRGGTVQPR